jgi:hypothetical protein
MYFTLSSLHNHLKANPHAKVIIATLLICLSLVLVWNLSFKNQPSINNIQFLNSRESVENYNFKNKSLLEKQVLEGADDFFKIKFDATSKQSESNLLFAVKGCVSEIFVNEKPILNPPSSQENFDISITQDKCQQDPNFNFNLSEHKDQNGVTRFEVLAESLDDKVNLVFSKQPNLLLPLLVLVLILLSVILFTLL